MTHPELALLLRDIADSVESGDSLEGSIEWHLPEQGDGVEVVAAIRTGNRQGQGGMLTVDTRPEAHGFESAGPDEVTKRATVALSPEELKQRLRDPNTRIVSAPVEATVRLGRYLDQITAAIKELFGIGDMYITDESCVSDFFDFTRDRAKDGELYAQLSERLGLLLDPANEDDHFLVKVARRLADKAKDISS